MFKCSVEGCNYSCAVRVVMHKHVMLHSRSHRRCDFVNCWYITDSVSNLNHHMRNNHDDNMDNLLCCPIDGCGYSTRNKGNLKRHTNSLHKNVVTTAANAKPSKPTTSSTDIELSQHDRLRSYMNSILEESSQKFPATVQFQLLPEEVELLGMHEAPDKFLAIIIDVSMLSVEDATKANNAALALISGRLGPRFLWVKGLSAKLSGLTKEEYERDSTLFTAVLTKRCLPLNSVHEAAASHKHIKIDLEDYDQKGTRMKYGTRSKSSDKQNDS
jgi:hypothetical protein